MQLKLNQKQRFIIIVAISELMDTHERTGWPPTPVNLVRHRHPRGIWPSDLSNLRAFFQQLEPGITVTKQRNVARDRGIIEGALKHLEMRISETSGWPPAASEYIRDHLSQLPSAAYVYALRIAIELGTGLVPIPVAPDWTVETISEAENAPGPNATAATSTTTATYYVQADTRPTLSR